MRALMLAGGMFGAVMMARAQTAPPAVNTVSATASTVQAMAAASANFRVQFLDANLNSTIDTALGVVGGAGASAANLSGVAVAVQQGFVVTTYEFLVVVPAGEFAATRDKLIAAQRAIANVNTQAISWTTSYTLAEDGAAKALELAMPRLLESARQQAGVLAAAMGARPGSIVAISSPALAAAGLNATVSATVTFAVERN